MKVLKPNFELLERIGITSRFRDYQGYKLEIEQKDFDSLKTFFKGEKAKESMEELFFYQLNFCENFSPETVNFIEDEKSFFQMLDQLQKVDFSKLQKIELEFSDRKNEGGEKISLHPDWVKLFGTLIKSEFEQDSKNREVTPKGKIKELNKIQKIDSVNRLRIQKAQPDILKIIQANNPEANQMNSFLCAYALFYQKGYRLKFDRDNTEKEDDELTEADFLQRIEETTNPMQYKVFDKIIFDRTRVCKNVKRK